MEPGRGLRGRKGWRCPVEIFFGAGRFPMSHFLGGLGHALWSLFFLGLEMSCEIIFGVWEMPWEVIFGGWEMPCKRILWGWEKEAL